MQSRSPRESLRIFLICYCRNIAFLFDCGFKFGVYSFYGLDVKSLCGQLCALVSLQEEAGSLVAKFRKNHDSRWLYGIKRSGVGTGLWLSTRSLNLSNTILYCTKAIGEAAPNNRLRNRDVKCARRHSAAYVNVGNINWNIKTISHLLRALALKSNIYDTD